MLPLNFRVNFLLGIRLDNISYFLLYNIAGKLLKFCINNDRENIKKSKSNNIS